MPQINQVSSLARIFDTFWGTFFGAAVALLFLPLTNLVGRVIKRRIQHYNSLVILESQLNEMMGIIKDNIYLLPTFRLTIKSANIYWSQIRTIPLDKSHLVNLADLGLINELFDFYNKIRKLNDDVESLSKGYNEIKNAYIEKLISVEHYVINSSIVSKELEMLEAFQEDLFEELLNLVTKIRLLIKKDKPLILKIQEFIKYNSSEKITLKEFKSEKVKVERELKQVSMESKEEIKKLLKKIKK